MDINRLTLKCIVILLLFLVLLTTISAYVKIEEEKRRKIYIEDVLLIHLEEVEINRNIKELPTEFVLEPKNTDLIPREKKTTTTTTVTTTTSTARTVAPTKTTTSAVTTTATTRAAVVEQEGNVYNITSAERDMLASLLYLEGGSTSRKCQKMIMEVVFNHYEHRGRKTSLTDIVYTKNMFSPAGRIKSTKAQQTQYDIVDEICQNGVTILPSYVLYFRASYHHSWATPYTNIDNVYFSYSAKDKK